MNEKSDIIWAKHLQYSYEITNWATIVEEHKGSDFKIIEIEFQELILWSIRIKIDNSSM